MNYGLWIRRQLILKKGGKRPFWINKFMQKLKLNRRHFVIGSSLLAATGAAPQAQSAPAGHHWRGPTMRSSQTQISASNNNQISMPPTEIIALNRMAFGPRPGDIERLMALGETTEERLDAYIEEQLSPNSIDDAECDDKLAERDFITMDQSLEQLWATYAISDAEYQDHYRPYHEVKQATFIKAIHSERQLLEVLADHWHNHFNVYGSDYWVAPIFAHYDRDVIRHHVLGNFRQMLEAVATSPEMLYYLEILRANSSSYIPWAQRIISVSFQIGTMYQWIMKGIQWAILTKMSIRPPKPLPVG